MKKTRFKKMLSFILCIMLVAAMALITTGCNDNTNSSKTTITDGGQLGQGDTEFTLVVADGEGNEKIYEIKTDKKTVGEALLELEIIAGENDKYGLYIKTVDGITVDFAKDKKYWAFYINDEYAQSGIDTTEITEGATYSLKVSQ